MSIKLIDEAMRTEALDILTKVVKEYCDLDQGTLRELVDHIPVAYFNKGTRLIEQGEVPRKCYFLLKGCVRKYSIDESGKEITVDFYTENQSINIFSEIKDYGSPYSLTTLEDSLMIVGNLDEEKSEMDNYPEFERIVIAMMSAEMGQLQDSFAAFISKTPMERVEYIMGKRPELFTRVPQHQLASYLGITPESLSRIKRRLSQDHLRIVE